MSRKMKNTRFGLLLVVLALMVGSCSHPTSSPPAVQDTTTHMDTSHMNNPLDSTHYHFASITIHGLSVLMSENVIPENVKGYTDTVQKSLERLDSLSFPFVSMDGDSIIINRDTSYGNINTESSIQNSQLYRFVLDTTNKIIMLAEFSYYHGIEIPEGQWDSSTFVDYQITNIPYNKTANGSISARISSPSIASHLYSYKNDLSLQEPYGGQSEEDWLSLVSVDSVASGAYIDIKLTP
jgi:hypothetical protein